MEYYVAIEMEWTDNLNNMDDSQMLSERIRQKWIYAVILAHTSLIPSDKT